jgi:hypothetical protein
MKKPSVLIILFSLALFFGCSDNKPTSSNNPGDTTGTSTTVWNNSGYWETRDLNASGTANYMFYSFTDKDTVTLTLNQALASSGWSLGFRRVSGLINSGQSGAGNTRAVDLASINHPDSVDFAGFTNISSVDTTQLQSGSYELIINEWYSYNPVSHTVLPTHNVYMSMDANGGYVKYHIIGIDNPGRSYMGTITIEYIYSGSSPTFSGSPDTITFTDSTGAPVYVDFSSGRVIHPANPLTSTDWDLEFVNYEIHQNNTIFGPGGMGTYEVWLDQHDPTDFYETSSFPNGAPPFPDDFGSPLTEWYNYIHPPGGNPTILSKSHVFLVKEGAHFYKMQIEAYYNHDSGTSGYYTFRWVEMQ